ncbi:hypothetical protein JL101_031480 (plasmid) [Skermanella rosea]|uniref:hypothetical protein n=1 Tax=Skermanella rosea TaxID=1817965 RepID=UPI0019345426|nr:hypothetical protein [Skermanella rosea]UEM07459.1 hypothetical protein JL101_031480 [Skermanella rosea]
MPLTIDMHPEPAAVQGARGRTTVNTDTWWRRVKEATVERYREWRFDRDIDQIHTALNRLSGRQLEMIGCRRDRLLEDVYRLVHNHAVADWCDNPLPLAAWVPPAHGGSMGGASIGGGPDIATLATLPRERVLEAA